VRSCVRVLIALAVSSTIAEVAAAPAAACSCAQLTKPQLGRAANVVFTGRAVSVAVSRQQLVATFVVQIGFKGAVPDTVAIITPSSAGSCGYRFEQGGLYTVFAARSAGHLTTSLCSGTTVGKIDPNVYGLVPKTVNGASSFFTVVLGALLVGGALWALLRRRRDARWREPPPAPPED
jgi:LPXTG-motif cell wall-anchored protein